MTDKDLISQAEELLREALAMARGRLDPTVVNSHREAVADGRRVLVLRVSRCAHRVSLEAGTLPRDSSGESGYFALMEAAERVAGDDFPTDSGC